MVAAVASEKITVAAAAVTNAISIDLEDWFCVNNLSGVIGRADWDSCELRVRESTEKILRLFERHRTRATFFTLGGWPDARPNSSAR